MEKAVTQPYWPTLVQAGTWSYMPPTALPIGTGMLAPGAIAPTKRLRSFAFVSTSSSMSRAVWAAPCEWPIMMKPRPSL